MKTPQEIVDGSFCQRPFTDKQSMLKWVESLQEDAFGFGWKQGMRDAQDMLSKGINLQMAIDAFSKSP